MPENASSPTASTAPPPGGLPVGQFFFECDLDGRITWMSDRARARLGPATNLLQALPEEILADTQRFLSGDSPAGPLVALLRPEQRSAVPVRLSRLLASGKRVVLSAEVRERSTDTEFFNVKELVALESRVLDKHFRLRRARQMLDSRLQRNRKNLGPVLMAQLERERARLGQELHAGAGQALSGIKIHLELLQRLLPEASREVRESLEKMDTLTQQAMAEVRSVSHRLQPPDWQSLKLADALTHLWRSSGIPQQFQATLNLAALAAEPAPMVRSLIYRSAQEALTNVARHSGASQVRMSLEESAGHLLLRVEDDGQGCTREQLENSSGIGLKAMTQQVRSFQGELRLASGPDGTKLEISVPLETTDEQA